MKMTQVLRSAKQSDLLITAVEQTRRRQEIEEFCGKEESIPRVCIDYVELG